MDVGKIDRRTAIKGCIGVFLGLTVGKGLSWLGGPDDKLIDACMPYSSRYDTIAHGVIDIEQTAGVLDADEKEVSIRNLEGLIDEARNDIRPIMRRVNKNSFADYNETEAAAVLDVIGDVVNKNHKYRANNVLGKGLLRDSFTGGYLDCDNRAIVYTAIGQVLDIPISAVIVPEHAFARWHIGRTFSLDQPDTRYINHETTAKRSPRQRSDEFYLSGQYHPKNQPIGSGIEEGRVMKSLTQEQILALAKQTSGIKISEDEPFGVDSLFKNQKKAVGLYDEAVDLNPNSSYSLFFNRGVANLRMFEFEKAIDDFTEAHNRAPDIIKSLTMRAKASYLMAKYGVEYEKTDNPQELFEKAKEDLDVVHTHGIGNGYTHYLSAHVHYELGDKDMALQEIKTTLEFWDGKQEEDKSKESSGLFMPMDSYGPELDILRAKINGGIIDRGPRMRLFVALNNQAAMGANDILVYQRLDDVRNNNL